jgi:RNA-directed DNA polymerase
MNSSDFKKNQLKHLAARLYVSIDMLKNVLENVEDHYYEYYTDKLDEEGRLRTYKDGSPKKREITPSNKELKKIQKSIKRNILDLIPMPGYVQGGIKKRSNITNAKIHLGKKFKFTTDINDFFPSITSRLVYNCFLQNKFTNHQARWLTILTTYKSFLPQGAPTSPGLSNLVFLPIDEILVDYCKDYNITYSRFIDDLTFSCPKDFKTLQPEIMKRIRKCGFNTSHRKTSYGTNLVVTGVHVHNNYIDVPLRIKNKVALEKEENAQNKPYTVYHDNVRAVNSSKIRKR